MEFTEIAILGLLLTAETKLHTIFFIFRNPLGIMRITTSVLNA